MPGVTGAKLAFDLRKLSPETKVVFMSGYLDSAAAGSSGGLGDVAFLEKPFTGEALSKKVREVLDWRDS
jgi:two-component system response regulator YesN